MTVVEKTQPLDHFDEQYLEDVRKVGLQTRIASAIFGLVAFIGTCLLIDAIIRFN